MRSTSVLAWSAPVVAGAALRLCNLDRQILLDDEMHTVLSAMYLTVRDILSTFKSEDPCLPLAAFYRALFELGVPFSEMTFRFPIVVVSLITVFALPRLALPWIGLRAALLLAWLLAFSPLLAIYGGMVRPYAAIALLGPAAGLALLRWREHGRIGWGLAYAALAALCLWFHLVTAPALAVPFAVLVVEKAFFKPVAPRWRDLLLVGAAALLLIAAFVVPAWDSLRELYAAKRGGGWFLPKEVPPILELQAGTSSPPVALLWWGGAACGLAVLLRRRRPLAVYVGMATLVQWVGLLVLAPIGLASPMIFNRYLIVTLPFLLLWLAAGLDATADGVARVLPLRRPQVAKFALPIVALALLVLAGPYADARFRRTSFRHTKDFLRFDRPLGRIAADAIPSFYRDHRKLRSSAPIAEFPFRGGWSQTRSHYVYQAVHGASVVAVEPFGWACDERLRLRNHQCPSLDVLPESSARYLVVHRDPLAEELKVEGGDSSGNDFLPEEWADMARTGRRVARQLRRRWGRPLLDDGRIAVWDLTAVRALAEASDAPSAAPE